MAATPDGKGSPAYLWREGTLCVIGAQWGDEGKGKIVDRLAAESHMVVRFQGGGNAGHTVQAGNQRLILHLIPSGILHAGVTCVIAGGVVVDPEQLLQELDQAASLGLDPEKRLRLSQSAHLVMPWHKRLDALMERALGNNAIGTTKRGIGPCYADKISRRGLRVMDMLEPERFRERVRQQLREKNRLLVDLLGGDPFDEEEILGPAEEYRRRLAPVACDSVTLINDAIDDGRRVLFEGAQGTLLNIDYGTYPFVTSSHSDACGIPCGAGIAPSKVGLVVGVCKAYATRVGAGPFPTELEGELADTLREDGAEYGATTGRPRRCGWLDLVALRHAVRLNGIKVLAMTKIDVLHSLDTIQVCVAYRLDGRELRTFPLDAERLARCEPVYEALPGWRRELRHARVSTELPAETRAYLNYIQDAIGIPIGLLSVGAGREELCFLEDPAAAS